MRWTSKHCCFNERKSRRLFMFVLLEKVTSVDVLHTFDRPLAMCYKSHIETVSVQNQEIQLSKPYYWGPH